MIFYGDHLPAAGLPGRASVEREGALTAHQTPFLIWSNRKPLEHTKLPTTRPIQFMPKLFNALERADPAVVRAARATWTRRIPAMDSGITMNPQDKRVKQSQLTPRRRGCSPTTGVIMYDLSIGKRYSEKTMYGDAP